VRSASLVLFCAPLRCARAFGRVESHTFGLKSKGVGKVGSAFRWPFGCERASGLFRVWT